MTAMLSVMVALTGRLTPNRADVIGVWAISGEDVSNGMADAVLEGHQDLSGFKVFVAGSPRMVYSTMDALENAGLEHANFFSDVLEYVSRDQVVFD